MQCKNNVKQLALGCLQHESLTRRVPTSGWGFAWTGDADRGNDWRQPGGWIYNILPYIEQQALHDLGTGMGPNPPCPPRIRALQTPLSIYNCPTRRKPNVYPWFTGITYAPVANGGDISQAARSDYAANGGDHYTDTSTGVYYGPQPTWFSAPSNGAAGPANIGQVENPAGNMTTAARNVFTYIASLTTGVSYCGSMIKMADISDGTSNTYLLGEKYIDADYILTGQDGGDNEGVLCGYDQDGTRFADTAFAQPPMQDTPGLAGWCCHPFRQRPRRRIPDGLLRRLREDDELLDRIRDPPAAWPTARTA